MNNKNNNKITPIRSDSKPVNNIVRIISAQIPYTNTANTKWIGWVTYLNSSRSTFNNTIENNYQLKVGSIDAG